MKLWGKVTKQHKIQKEVVREFSSARPSTADGWAAVITELVKPLDLALPVILNKHVTEMERFSRTVFKAEDFMEPIAFDTFEVELFPEKKKETQTEYFFA